MLEDQQTEELDLRKGAPHSDGLPRARDQRVHTLTTDDYVAVSPYTPLSQAIEAMKSAEDGCVIISDDGRVRGIFTERDLLTKVAGQDVDLDSPISEWMQSTVFTLTPEATIGDAVRLMNEKSFRNIPLEMKGELIGSISVFDIITYLAECYPKTTMNLPPLPAQVMDTVDGG
jgi:signal-transduction protein with cAMP-binding, CBS, and nucleotidyltransferase domain